VRQEKTISMVILLFVAGLLCAYQLPKEVIHHPSPADPLAARVEWALAEAQQRGYGGGFWVGYSIKRLMGERSYIGTSDCGRKSEELTLQEIISGKTSAMPLVSDRERIRRTTQAVLDELEKEKREPEKKVWKDVAIMFRFGAGKPTEIEKVELSNVSLAFDLEGRPLIWLGEAPDGQSISLLHKHYDSAKLDHQKKQMIAAAGVHGTPALVIPFLEEILKSGTADNLRKDAAFWLGQQDTQAACTILRQTAEKDRSGEVRKEAVFAMSQLEIEASVDGLIDLARNASDEEVKKQAIFWLGQKASKKAGAALEGFAYDAADSRIQEQAVFALSQLPDNEGLDALIKIAKTHPNPSVRKKAVFWLGESHDPRALETLIQIVKDK
jgi:hypothetical protein